LAASEAKSRNPRIGLRNRDDFSDNQLFRLDDGDLVVLER
jgi:hypothetical protein